MGKKKEESMRGTKQLKNSQQQFPLGEQKKAKQRTNNECIYSVT